jgi:hypothetical protein
VQLLPHFVLCRAVGTTLIAAEIAARAGAWDESSSRRNLGTFARQARVVTRVSQTSLEGSQAVSRLWSSLMSGSGDPVDAFASILFLIFRWPARLTEQDVKHLICAGYVSSVDSARRGRHNTVLGSIIYLRRAALLIGCLYDRPIGLHAYTDSGAPMELTDMTSEHIQLTKTLGLPRPEEASLAWLVEEEAAAAAVDLTSSVSRPLVVPRRLGLVQLPPVFQELLEKLDGEHCHSCKRPPKRPAMCLLCSKVFCSSRGEIVREQGRAPTGCLGYAKRHALSCGAGVGVFLLLKTTNVNVYRGDRVAVWGSPFLDEHGEEDAELRRGKPLLLSRERYAALERLWLSHGFDHNARMLQQTVLQVPWTLRV